MDSGAYVCPACGWRCGNSENLASHFYARPYCRAYAEIQRSVREVCPAICNLCGFAVFVESFALDAFGNTIHKQCQETGNARQNI